MKKLLGHFVSLAALGFTAGAMAAGPDLTALTGTVDFATTLAAILAIAASLAGVFVTIRAAKTILGMIKGR